MPSTSSTDASTPSPPAGGSRRRAVNLDALSLATALRAEVDGSVPTAEATEVGGSPVSTVTSGVVPVAGMAGECVLFFVDDVLMVREVSSPGGLPPSVEGGCLGRRVARRGRWIGDGAMNSLPLHGEELWSFTDNQALFRGVDRVREIRPRQGEASCHVENGIQCLDVKGAYYALGGRGICDAQRKGRGAVPQPWAGVRGVEDREEGELEEGRVPLMGWARRPDYYMIGDAGSWMAGGVEWIEGRGMEVGDWWSRRPINNSLEEEATPYYLAPRAP